MVPRAEENAIYWKWQSAWQLFIENLNVIHKSLWVFCMFPFEPLWTYKSAAYTSCILQETMAKTVNRERFRWCLGGWSQHGIGLAYVIWSILLVQDMDCIRCSVYMAWASGSSPVVLLDWRGQSTSRIGILNESDLFKTLPWKSYEQISTIHTSKWTVVMSTIPSSPKVRLERIHFHGMTRTSSWHIS